MLVQAIFRDRRVRPKASDPMHQTPPDCRAPEQGSRCALIRAQETLKGLGYGMGWEMEFETRQPRSGALLGASRGPILWPIQKWVFAGTPIVNFCS